MEFISEDNPFSEYPSSFKIQINSHIFSLSEIAKS